MSEFSFRLDQRVTERAEYLRVSREGRRIATPHFVFLLAKSKTPCAGRLGITVTKKIGNSVARSRYKRLIREAFRLNPDFHLQDLALVVIVRAPNSSLKLGEVVEEWRQALPKMRAAARKV